MAALFFFFDGQNPLASSEAVSRATITRFRNAFVTALLAAILPACAKAKYETPDYRVINSEGAFEIREYPSLTLVSTPMSRRGEDGSFMKLFRFISGKNDRSEKISMTTPVLMTGSESGTMSFVVPRVVAERGAPAPSSPDVTVSTVPSATYAAYRFSGSGKPAPSEAAAKKLLAWATSRHLHVTGTPLFAYYNPPWTPWFLRRNEVLVKVAPAR